MSVSEEAKKAAVARIARLAPEGTGRARHVRAEAASLRVDVRTIYRWLAEDAIQPPQPTAFEITTEHLTVLANTQNRLAAYRALRTADEIDVSYATFCRGLKGLLHG